jgi:hypothetical protein
MIVIYTNNAIRKKWITGVFLAAAALAVFLPGAGSNGEPASDEALTAFESPAGITLTIDVREGNGHAIYSVNGEHFRAYSTPVSMTDFSSFVVIAFSDNGYVLGEWRMGAETFPSSEITFNDVTESKHLELYFIENTGSIGAQSVLLEDSRLLIAAIAIVIAAIALAFVMIDYRRTYTVIIPECSAVVGSERAHKKKEYRFATIDEYNGEVKYCVGEDGSWKTIVPNESGEYIIPREDVVGDLRI